MPTPVGPLYGSSSTSSPSSKDRQSEHIAEIVGKVIAAAAAASTGPPIQKFVPQSTAEESNMDDCARLKRQFQEWMNQRNNNLYPSRQDKERLAEQLGTSFDQITRLLANHRRRYLKSRKYVQQPSANDKENQQQQNYSPQSVHISTHPPYFSLPSSVSDNSTNPTVAQMLSLYQSGRGEPTKHKLSLYSEPMQSKENKEEEAECMPLASKMMRMEAEREQRIDNTIDSIIESNFGVPSSAREEGQRSTKEAVAAILQLQSVTQRESALTSPPPPASGAMGVMEKKPSLLQQQQQQQQFSPTFSQVVPDLSLSMSLSSSQHYQSSPLLMNCHSNHNQSPEQQQIFGAHHLLEKQQDNSALIQQLLAKQQLISAFQQQQQQQQLQLPGNAAAAIAALTQQQQQLQQQQGVVPTPMLGANPTLAASLQALIQQQLLANQQQQHESGAAQALVMQLAIQKELQILYQRQYLSQFLQQQLSQSQSQSAANPPINFLSPPLTHTPASDEASYATSTPNSFVGSASIPSTNSPMNFITSQQQQQPQQQQQEVEYDLEAFEKAIAARHGQALTEKESVAVAVLAAGFSGFGSPSSNTTHNDLN